jgi:hypothetical protein
MWPRPDPTIIPSEAAVLPSQAAQNPSEARFLKMTALGRSVNRGNGAALSGDIRAEGEGFEPPRANRPPPS